MYYPSKLYSRISSSDNTKYIYVGNTLIATVRTKDSIVSPYYIHTDYLGSTNAVSNSTGTVELLDYYSYGSDKTSTGSCDIRRKYIGEYCDNDTSLAYLNARYYNSYSGRFISQDPAFLKLGSSKFEEDYNIKLQYYLMNPQSLNSYSYANNNPVIWSDPGGEILPLIAIAGIAWATAEVGLSAYDIYATSEILADENVSAEDKAFTTSLTVAGVFLPGGGYGTVGRGVVKAGKYITKNADSLIQISKSKLQHVVKRHAWNSTENVSTFLKGIDPVKLINKASDSVGSIQKNGNIERIIKSDVSIGYDYLTKKTTDVYTVITKLLKDGKEELVTVFPGLPKP